jgi:hypothetical protein
MVYHWITVETCVTLLMRDVRRNLFTVFAGWSGRFGRPLGHPVSSLEADERPCSELQLSALQAKSALLCCGPCFNPHGLAEDGLFYPWLDMLLASHDEKVRFDHLLLLFLTCYSRVEFVSWRSIILMSNQCCGFFSGSSVSRLTVAWFATCTNAECHFHK